MIVQLLIQEDGAGDFELLGRPMDYGKAQQTLFDIQRSQTTWLRLHGQSYFANSRIILQPINHRLPVNTEKVAA